MVGLGVLSIPLAFDSLGLIPGIICMLAIAIITTWSDYVVGVFKLNHPDVYGIDDVGHKLFGRVGRIFFGGAFCLYWVFVSGSGMLSISIAFNTLSEHGTCTAVFVAIAAIIGFGLSSIRTLGKMTWLAWVGLAGILTSIFVLTIAVGVQDRPAAAPQTGPWEPDFKLFNRDVGWAEAIAAVSSLVFAYAGTPAFFSIVSEMRDPRMYTRSLICCQTAVTVTYIVIGTVVYYYCGSLVTSPALGSAGTLMKKVCYGLALPGLIVTVTLVSHVSAITFTTRSSTDLRQLPAKYFFLWILRGSKHLTANSFVHWATWLGCTFAVCISAYIIASAIPVFGGLVSLIGALLGTLMSFQPMGFMWLYDNWSRDQEKRTAWWRAGVCWSIFVIVIGSFLMVSGTYGSIVGIMDSYRESGGSAAWSCADNSAS